MQITQLVPAEAGWKAVFEEPDGSESVSRILGWAVGDDESDDEVFGVVVDPSSPSQIVAAPDAVSPTGGMFSRYRFVPPEPLVVQTPAPPPPPPEEQDAAEQLAKGLLKRRRS